MVSKMNQSFAYQEFTTRNIGFVNETEQMLIRNAKVFVCGVGGMGGACVQSLVRSGIGQLAIADFDEFEVSNFNRQVFANMDTAGKHKAIATVEAVKKINPEIAIEQYGKDWTDYLDKILSQYKIVINGMDDIRAGIFLYRKAREHNAIVIDAYTSPLPSVTCVKPKDPRPEERFQSPSLGKAWKDLTDEDVSGCFIKEMEYVLANSSSIKHIHLNYAIEMISGKRSRMSFAPMVVTTGNLMCYEAIKIAINDAHTTNHLGYFFNPYLLRIERPRPLLIRKIVTLVVKRYLRKMLNAA